MLFEEKQVNAWGANAVTGKGEVVSLGGKRGLFLPVEKRGAWDQWKSTAWHTTDVSEGVIFCIWLFNIHESQLVTR